jgi:hypothetical protein
VLSATTGLILKQIVEIQDLLDPGPIEPDHLHHTEINLIQAIAEQRLRLDQLHRQIAPQQRHLARPPSAVTLHNGLQAPQPFIAGVWISIP